MDEWMDRLRAGAGGARPTGDAHRRVSDELGRRRRRRHGLTAAAAVASVVLIAGAAAAVPRLVSDDDSRDVSNTTSMASPAAESFSCPRENPVFTEEPPKDTRPVDQRALDPVLRYVRHLTRGIPGLAGFAYWPEASAIFVQWKRPVPERVRHLEDIQFKSGGQVIVRGVTYSAADIRRAWAALNPYLRETGLREHWSTYTACGDFAGAEVGMHPDFLADTDVAQLQRDLSDAAGIPVAVVPEGPVVPLG